MIRYGNTNIIQSEVKSDGFASDEVFNKVIVNDMSEINQATLDHDVIVFNKGDDKFYTYDVVSDSWNTSGNNVGKVTDTVPNTIYINDVMDVYNQIRLNDNAYLECSPDVVDFGELGSPENFVIDFWMKPEDRQQFGTILYNGKNTGQVDIEQNKNILITTSGETLVKDPNFQADPTITHDISKFQYINIHRPKLKSARRIIDYHLLHVALIRSGDTTYLAINGTIEDSAPSVEYFHYDNVLIGGGHWNSIKCRLINFRITKNTDFGWTTNFIPPNYNPIVDENTQFLLDSTSNVCVDNTGNHSISVVGVDPSFTQDRFFYQLDADIFGNTISSNLSQDIIVFRLPETTENYQVYFDVDDTPFKLITDVNYSGLKDDGLTQAISIVLATDTKYLYAVDDNNLIFDPPVSYYFNYDALRFVLTPFNFDTIYSRSNLTYLVHESQSFSDQVNIEISNNPIQTSNLHNLPTETDNNYISQSCYTQADLAYGTNAGMTNLNFVKTDLIIIDMLFYCSSDNHHYYIFGYPGRYFNWFYYTDFNQLRMSLRYSGTTIIDTDNEYENRWVHYIATLYNGNAQVHNRQLDYSNNYKLYEATYSTSYHYIERHLESTNSYMSKQFQRIQRIPTNGQLTAQEIQDYVSVNMYL